MACSNCGQNSCQCASDKDFETTDSFLNFRIGGMQGTVDLDSGALIVAGRVVATEPDLSQIQRYEVVGKFGSRIANLTRRIVRAAPLRKLAGAFGSIAARVGHLVPAPYGTALQAAGRVASAASRIGRGDTSARASVANLATTALSVTNPDNARARAALNAINSMANGQVPPQVASAYRAATSAVSVARGLRAGHPAALATARALVVQARTNPRARIGLNTLRNAFREMSTNVSGPETSEVREAATILWGVIRPHIGVRPSSELGLRDAYIQGVDIMARGRNPNAT